MSLWEDKFININKYARSGKKITKVKKIVIHWTANYGGTAENHFTYFSKSMIASNMKLPEKKRRYASAHFFVDKNEALCILPLNEIGYHANDGKVRKLEELKPNANYLSIGIEMCVEKDGTFHKNTISRTEDIAVELCKKYKLNPLKDIVRHYDITGKSCPAPWISNGKLFTEFKSRVNTKYNGISKSSTKVEDNKVLIDGVVEVLVDDLNLRSNSNTKAPIIRTLNKGSKWKAYKIENGFYNLGGNQWVSASERFVKFTPNNIGTIKITVDSLNIRSGSSLSSPIVSVALKGQEFPIYEEKNNMYRINDGKWVSASEKYVKVIK